MKTSIATSPAGRKSAKGSQVRPVGLLAGLVSSIVPLWYPHERLVRLLNGRIGFCRIPRAGCQAAPINRRWPLWGRMTSSYSPRPPRQRPRRVENDEERYDTEICARPYFVRLGLWDAEHGYFLNQAESGSTNPDQPFGLIQEEETKRLRDRGPVLYFVPSSTPHLDMQKLTQTQMCRYP